MLRFEKMVLPNVGAVQLGQMEAWSALSKGYSFVITLDRGCKPDPEYRDKYVASWKKRYDPCDPGFIAGTVHKVDGGPWDTLEQAEAACKAAGGQLIRKT